jgi:hypothetical protein
MSIDGLMPPNLVNMTAMIRDISAYAGFAQHKPEIVDSSMPCDDADEEEAVAQA